MDTTLYLDLPYQVQPTMAWLWFAIPAALALLTGVIAICSSTTTIKGTSLGVLGMQQAGKTQLIRNLQNKEYRQYEATSTDDYAAFDVLINGRNVKIAHGRDIGGDERYIKDYYDEFLRNKDAVFFVFDVSRYLSNRQYADQVRARLDFIYQRIKPTAERSNIKEKYITLGSHMDLLSSEDQKNALNNLQKSVYGKPYSIMFHNNLLLCDLTKRDKFMDHLTKKKIF